MYESKLKNGLRLKYALNHIQPYVLIILGGMTLFTIHNVLQLTYEVTRPIIVL